MIQMPKLTTEAVRLLVAAEAVRQKNKIRAGYIDCDGDDPNTLADVERIGEVANWKRYNKFKEGGGVTRIFDNVLMDGTLRAYVFSDAADENVISISIEIE
jgi:ssDNA-binding replication factor A large subunit